MIIDDQTFDSYIVDITEEIRKEQTKLAQITQQMQQLQTDGDKINEVLFQLNGERNALLKLRQSQMPGNHIETERANDPKYQEFVKKQTEIAMEQLSDPELTKKLEARSKGKRGE